MTKYIGKKIIVSIMILLTATFILYFLVLSMSISSDSIFIDNGNGIGVSYDDGLYFYKRDTSARIFSPLYFIPVHVAHMSEDSIYLLSSEYNERDLHGKYYISLFSREHVIYRSGLDRIVYTLHSIEKLS